MTGTAPERLVFVDETHLTLSMTPLQGRAPRGERVIGRVPRRRWESVTFLAALGPTGYISGVAIPGAVDGDAFATYVREGLVPALQTGQTVIWDNLNVHKNAGARRAIEAAGCQVVFLPRYSPDFNPIEPSFAKLKTHVRRAEPRTWDALIDALDHGMRAVTEQDVAGFFAHTGYRKPGPHL